MIGKPRTIPAGERFGRLTVTRTRQPAEPRIACICDCGKEHEVGFTSWGRTKSCGCLTREAIKTPWHLRPMWQEPCAKPEHVRESDPERPGRTRCQTCKLTTRRESAARTRARLREQFLAAYGGRCACCGEHRAVFLTIDHVNEDGAAHRRELSAGRQRQSGGEMYRWLQRNGYPAGFQILCFNCNYAKHHLGECPHQTERRGDGGLGQAV